MKNLLLNVVLSLVLTISFSSQAKVFTCSGIITDVFSTFNTFEVRYERASGFELEPVIVYPEQTYLLAPILMAIAEGKNGSEYTLIIENRNGNDSRCHDGESENALIGLSKIN